MTIEDGYAIQRAWVALEIADGRTVKGRKIGLTSRAMQQASQITEPDYAPLMDDMFFAQGSDIPVERFIAPRVEVELAFILGKPLRGPGVTLFDVLAATEYVTLSACVHTPTLPGPANVESSTSNSGLLSTDTTNRGPMNATRKVLHRPAGTTYATACSPPFPAGGNAVRCPPSTL
jgi:hypothetical protein